MAVTGSARRLTALQYLTHNVYWLGLNMITGSLTPILLPYLVALLVPEPIKASALGALRSGGLIVAILVQPAAGLLSDRCALRWGRRRPFIVVGTILDLFFLTLLLFITDYWTLFVVVMLVQASSNVAHGAMQGVIPDLVPEDQRGKASAVKAMMELLPMVIAALTTARLVGAGRVGEAILVIAAVLVSTMGITVVAVREEPCDTGPRAPLSPELSRTARLAFTFLVVTALCGGLVAATGRVLQGRGLWQVAGVWISGLVAMVGAIVLGVQRGVRAGLGPAAERRSSFSWWVVNRLLYLAAVGSIQGFALYFLQDVLRVANPPVVTGRLMMIVGIFTLLAAFPSGWLADRIGCKSLLVAAGLLSAVGTFLLFLASNLIWVAVCGAILGLGAGVFWTTSWTLGTHLVPPDEAGRYLGISNLAGAGAGIIGAGIGGPLVDFINAYQHGAGYLAVFSIYGILFVLSALVMARVWDGSRRPLV